MEQMDIEVLETMWSKDMIIDKSDLITESLQHRYELWFKYRKLYTRQALWLHQLKADAKKLKLDKYEHYTQGGSQEAARMGWKLPPIGKVLKTDVEKYMDGDKEIISSNLKIAYQVEVVEMLEGILDQIGTRQWSVKAAQQQMVFDAGGRISI